MRKFLNRLSGLRPAKNNNNEDEAVETEEENENDDMAIGNGDHGQEMESADNDSDEWLSNDFEEGQLSIDVYQTQGEIIVKSTIAGVKPEDIDISINNDMLTIRGKREMQERVRDEHYLYRECYWGSFSRSVILPVEIDASKIEAILENGVLTISLPKAKVGKQISIKVREK